MLLAGATSLSALAALPEPRPRPEDYASYSLYLQALFAYQRSHQVTEFPEPSLIQNQDGSPAQPESLEDAIQQASQGNRPAYVDNSGKARSTFKTFGLNQIDSQDLSGAGVDGVLGIFGTHNPKKAKGPRIAGLYDDDGTFTLFPDADQRNLFDEYAMDMAPLHEQLMVFNTTVQLDGGWAYANGSSTANPDGSLSLTLNSDVQTTAFMVDRDGLPGRSPGAGAFIIDPLRLKLDGVNANIRAENRAYPDAGLLVTNIYTNNSIRANLSGTRIGVAEATKGAPDFERMTRDDLGPPSYFMQFGPNSELVIAPGTTMKSVLERPDGRNRPLVTANARIHAISLTDMSVVDNANGGRLNIARFSMTDLLLKDLKIYVIGQKVELDSEVRDVKLAAYDISAGSSNAPSMGDVFMDITRMRSKVTFEAH